MPTDPMQYFKHGQSVMDPIVQRMRERKAGEVAAALNQSGDFNSPALGDPMVQDALSSQMKLRQMSELLPIESQIKQLQVARTLQGMSQSDQLNTAKANYYNSRAQNPGGSGKKFTGNIGNLMQLTDDITDLQEELAQLQMNPDPDPDTHAMRMNRLQSQIQELNMVKELQRKKIEKEGLSGGPKVSIAPDKEGNMVQKISGNLGDPELQKHVQKTEAMKQIQWLGTQPDTYTNNLGETKAQELQRLQGMVLGESAQPAAPAEQPAPVAKPVQKAGGIYRDANGRRAKFLGGDPRDPASWQEIK